MKRRPPRPLGGIARNAYLAAVRRLLARPLLDRDRALANRYRGYGYAPDVAAARIHAQSPDACPAGGR